MNPNKSLFLASSLIITALLIAYSHVGTERVEDDMLVLADPYVGTERVEDDMIHLQKACGIRDITKHDVNWVEMEDLVRFAIREYQNYVNLAVRLHRLVKAKEQVVAGSRKVYHLTFESKFGDGMTHVYETLVWVKCNGTFDHHNEKAQLYEIVRVFPWMGCKEMLDFKEIR